MGQIGILNVGAGDTKLSFDKDNPAERIRAARIVTDMLRRGYALIIEVMVDGQKTYQRVHDFREDTCEYIIADLDPVAAAKADEERAREEGSQESAGETAPAPAESSAPRLRRGKRATRAVPAEGTSGVAVGRSAGG